MDAEIQKHIESLFGYCMRTDARLMAMQMTIADLLNLNDAEKKVLEERLEANYKILLQLKLEDVEKLDAGLAARLVAGENPYSGLA
jgi:hypothetical protein